MKSKDAKAELDYRLCVIILDHLKNKELIDENEYDQIRVNLAKKYEAPIGLFESEEMLWKEL